MPEKGRASIKAASVHVESDSVFINCPFEKPFEKQLIAIIAVLVGLGKKIHCSLEIPNKVNNRSEKVFSILRRCETSIHDLSRVKVSKQLNMPYELGLAVGVQHLINNKHAIFLLEKKPHEVEKYIRDLHGLKVCCHHGTVNGTINCLLDAFGNFPGIDRETILRVYKPLQKMAIALRNENERNTINEIGTFNKVLTIANKLAAQQGLIQTT